MGLTYRVIESSNNFIKNLGRVKMGVRLPYLFYINDLKLLHPRYKNNQKP